MFPWPRRSPPVRRALSLTELVVVLALVSLLATAAVVTTQTLQAQAEAEALEATARSVGRDVAAQALLHPDRDVGDLLADAVDVLPVDVAVTDDTAVLRDGDTAVTAVFDRDGVVNVEAGEHVLPAYPQVVLDDDPVAYWRFASDTVARDDVGENDAALAGVTLGVDGPFDAAAQVAPDGYMQASPPGWDGADTFIVEAWVQPEFLQVDGEQWSYVLLLGDSGWIGSSDVWLGVVGTSGDAPTGDWGAAYGGAWQDVPASTTAAFDVWTHVAAVAKFGSQV